MGRRRFERALLILTGVQVVAGAALLGGVHPIVQVYLSAAALGVLLAVVILRYQKRADLGWGAPFWILLGLATVCLLQLVSLPEGLWRLLSPRAAALVSYSTEGLGGPLRRCLSLDPPGTALELCKLVGFASMAASAALLVRDTSRGLLLMWSISIAGMLLAGVAMVQLLAGGGAIYGIYRPEVGSIHITPFVNPNHAGAFYGAVGFLHLGLSLQIVEVRRRMAALALAALPLSLVVASASRGAIAATVVATLVLLLVQRWLGRIDTRQLGYAVAIALIVGTVAFPASETIRREFGDRTTVETIPEDNKVKVWADALPMARDFPLTGIGRGAFRSVFPRYFHAAPGLRVTYSHAENLLVQLLVELGPVLLLLLLVAIGVATIRFSRRTTLGPEHATALLPILFLLGQNLVDFNLEFPGTGFFLVTLLGVLAGLSRGRTRRRPRRGRRVGGLVGGLVFVLLAGTTLALAGPQGVRWDLRSEGRKLRATVNGGEDSEATLRAVREAVRRHPSDFYLHYLAGVAAMGVVGEQPLRHFNRALYLSPHSGITHRQVGRALWHLGFPRQALEHYVAAIRRGVPVGGSVASELYGLLRALYDAGAWGQARREASYCLAALALPGQIPSASCLLAVQLGQTERSRGFERLSRLSRAGVTALARRLAAESHWNEAMGAFGAALALFPEDEDLLQEVARFAEKNKDMAPALYWSRVLAKVQPSPAAFDRVGKILLQANRLQQAEQVADQGLLRYPRSPGLVALKAELLLRKGRGSDALILIREATLGGHLSMREELRLLQLQVQIEQRQGNRLRVERLKSRIRQIRRMLKAGVRTGSQIR